MKLSFYGVLLGVASGAVGCSSADGAPAPRSAEREEPVVQALAAVNARCPAFGTDRNSGEAPRDDLFAEAVILDVPSALAPQVTVETVSELARVEGVRLLGTPHLLGGFEKQSEMAIDNAGTAHEELAFVRLAMVPRHADRGAVVELELEVELPRLEPGAPAARRAAAFSTTARDNEPTLARVEIEPGSPRSLLVLLRTFQVHSDAELRAILQCKMDQHTRASRR